MRFSIAALKCMLFSTTVILMLFLNGCSANDEVIDKKEGTSGNEGVVFHAQDDTEKETKAYEDYFVLCGTKMDFS